MLKQNAMTVIRRRFFFPCAESGGTAGRFFLTLTVLGSALSSFPFFPVSFAAGRTTC